MAASKVLLLDFNPGTGSILWDVVRSPDSLVPFKAELLSASWPTDYSHELVAKILSRNPDIILFNVSSNSLSEARFLIPEVRCNPDGPVVVVVLETSDPGEMYKLLTAGASDFITLPIRSADVLPRIWRLLEQQKRKKNVEFGVLQSVGLHSLIGASPEFMREIKKIPIIAGCDATVLISGETGCGKELFARAIHYLSPRSRGPFIPVNCGAIPTELIESELFGHEKGAFTGASSRKDGLIKEAKGGTLFLDEIDSLSSASQVKLLRFLQDKEVRAVGSNSLHEVDVRVIAATNANLKPSITEGTLRKDLYYRLNILSIVLPSLRERRQDIPFLAEYFRKKYCLLCRKHISGFAPGTIEKLILYDWPGNVRELEHAVERAVVLCQEELISERDFEMSISDKSDNPVSLRQAKARVVEEFEKSYLSGVLGLYQGNVTKAAAAARKHKRAFYELLRKYQIDPDRFRLTKIS
jgi:two-component system, NtrC family, response regulator GlrR